MRKLAKSIIVIDIIKEILKKTTLLIEVHSKMMGKPMQINKIFAESFTIGSAMRMEDEKMNGMPPSFDMHF